MRKNYNNIKYIFTYIYEDLNLDPQNGLFKDLNKVKNLTFKNIYKNWQNPLLKFFRRVVLSGRVKKYINITAPFSVYDFVTENISKQYIYILIIPTVCITKIDLSYLRYVKKKYSNVFLVPLLLDSLNAHSIHLQYLGDKLSSDLWDMVLCFDKGDSEKHGFSYIGYSYYSSFTEIPSNKRNSDIQYIGIYKGGREQLLGDVYNILTKHSIECNFHVVSDQYSALPNSTLKTSKKRMTYPEVVSMIKSSNCILELLQNDQETQSIRYFEAVVYNKKLLSNNPHLSELPYYDARYMRYFAKAEDIDWDWVKKKENIDYHYQGDFSPVKLIDIIEVELTKQGKL